MPTATTYIKPYKKAADKSAVQTMQERFEYALNPEKLGAVSSYLCDYTTAHSEFLLVHSQYKAETGREPDRGALFFQIRQAFKPGEITPEEANRIGYETAMRWTKGKYQFFVCTHIDKGHIHNHIYYNSTAYDCSRKYHNFIGSSFALRRLSDRVCLENDLSVILNPKLHSKGRFIHYGQWIGEKPPSAKQRVRASTLGAGFDPADIRDVIAGKRPIPEIPHEAPAPRKVSLVIDIQERLRSGKGPAYERWAKVYNLKQMAAALQYLKEHGIADYDELAAGTDAAVERSHKLAVELQAVETELAQTADLMGAVVDYAKTRPVFDGYKASKYSKKYLAQHEDELATYRAARATMKEILDGGKLPRINELKEKRRQLAAQKKTLYMEYRQAQDAMREAVTVKANIDRLLGLADERINKEQER